ncbi:dTDP-4-dehydrorhamnose reductase [Duganella sp. Root198D2]|uniref:dTDP-4-dehydrorhamnose reductase n=1 Tax=Duganella sp. Root198D2 TaxID=1736489 RepID=UPI00070A100A|nr:dTDP-4-dehydrorhamnose reductase [Duganella sp. Root198D2]KRB83383.1 dTDP-4-dehydrorhamnose reductase [Duganella sp. Root198D2]
MKILLIGKNGQVGHELQRTLLPLGELVALGRDGLDLSDLTAVKQVLESQAADVIVNASAYTAVDRAEADEAGAQAVNGAAVAAMAAYASARNALLVHYSTDYVFDGDKPAPYVEDDATAPQSAYGRSKRAGEEAIMASGCKALVFRTSWVFSAHGGNFIKTMLRLAGERDSLNVVADQFGAPTSAELIADVTALAVAAYRRSALAGGIYHLTAAGATSWHGLASYAIERAKVHGAALKVDPEQIKPIPTEAYPVPAKRPKNSRLDTSKLSTALDLQLPDWKIHVDRLIEQLS